jgi:Ca2+-binding EF-hand superfamily protein
MNFRKNEHFKIINMGNGCSKSYLKEKEYELLEAKFGKTHNEIDRILTHFKEKSLNDHLDKRQFEELLSLLWSESIKTDGPLLDTIFSAFDSNGSGYVTLEQFLTACSETVTFEQSAIEDAFNTYYDKDRKGSINYDKLKSSLNELV